MRRPMVAGNWKMNGSRDFAADLMSGIAQGLADVSENTDVVACPPFPYLHSVGDAAEAAGRVALGAQNLDTHESGAYTGEVSGPMLVDSGCTYVIVGHSERRAYYGESNEVVADKTAAAQAHGLVPIVCVGETLEQREANETESVIAAQLDAVVERIGIDAVVKAVIAYEPVWAIGTGMTATPEQAQDVHRFIRERLATASAEVADGVRILYGGSVKPDNAAGLFANADIDGGLIGGASLKAEDFLGICRATA